MTKIENCSVDKSYEIYLSLYQAEKIFLHRTTLGAKKARTLDFSWFAGLCCTALDCLMVVDG